MTRGAPLAAPERGTPRRAADRRTALDVSVAWWTDRLSGHIERHPRFWIGLGHWETKLLRDRLEGVSVDRPVYVTGLARAGTTILLEILARHHDTATHRYRDYPPVLTPWAWNRFVDRAARETHVAVERAHGDRIMVTPESPEAFEELLWMAFFPDLHDPDRSAVLDERVDRPAFEGFYRDHVRKLLLLRGGSRYLAKGNYNVTRLAYIQKIFPDARFVVPIRDPVRHVASLARQHERFTAAGAASDRVRRHMRRSGHFEFGLDRAAVHVGDDAAARRIREFWRDGREIEGWATYWALIYGHLRDTLERRPGLRAATRVVRYEDLCAAASDRVTDILEHCGLTPNGLPEMAAGIIEAPRHDRRPPFTPEEREVIRRCTEPVARAFGYRAVG
jgi:Sulfotransferase family